MSPFVILTLQYLILIIFDLLDTSLGGLIQLTSKLIVASIFVIAFPIMWKRAGNWFLCITGVVILIFLSQYLFYIPNRNELVGVFSSAITLSLPIFIYTLALRDLYIFNKVMDWSANLIFIMALIIGILVLSGNASVGVYSMALSYYILLPSLIFLNKFLNNFNLFNLVLFLTSLIIIISLGSRGSLLCIGFFVFLKLFKMNWDISRKEMITRLFVFISILFTIFQKNSILKWLEIKLQNYGISSRTITLLQQEEIYLSGREDITSTIMTGIYSNPIAGNGIAGDRVLTGTYAHNIFVEILSSFGAMVGLVLIIVLVLLIVKTLISSNGYLYDSICIWISIGFISLMVSSSFLINMKFWVLIGILISVTKLNTRNEFKGGSK